MKNCKSPISLFFLLAIIFFYSCKKDLIVVNYIGDGNYSKKDWNGGSLDRLNFPYYSLQVTFLNENSLIINGEKYFLVSEDSFRLKFDDYHKSGKAKFFDNRDSISFGTMEGSTFDAFNGIKN